ncbi:hypothetical protein H6G76_26660 [Nostoc sp. FACHB-152]|uniref:hypothetical protein n=1 Tax=unclassified Nostoc TaxID=2593658 RepID=UPI0016861FFF|nr:MULTISPECIES: hypothetical protein [unclassified Nostoc]MBD2450647.1 hypothetical protein [Nostoc sp. FACHB-152]MBD2470115.1 hypothetical protein [Nostoc sp. FACHB-145]
MDVREVIGERGESIFRVLITRKHPSRGYLFEHPRFLGEKKRTIDFYVELFHDDFLIPFFFVQVKSTSQGYTQSDRRLKVKVTDSDMKRESFCCIKILWLDNYAIAPSQTGGLTLLKYHRTSSDSPAPHSHDYND